MRQWFLMAYFSKLHFGSPGVEPGVERYALYYSAVPFIFMMLSTAVILDTFFGREILDNFVVFVLFALSPLYFTMWLTRKDQFYFAAKKEYMSLKDSEKASVRRVTSIIDIVSGAVMVASLLLFAK